MPKLLLAVEDVLIGEFLPAGLVEGLSIADHSWRYMSLLSLMQLLRRLLSEETLSPSERVGGNGLIIVLRSRFESKARPIDTPEIGEAVIIQHYFNNKNMVSITLKYIVCSLNIDNIVTIEGAGSTTPMIT